MLKVNSLIKSDGVLESFFGFDGIDPRFFNWLCFYLCLEGGDGFARKLEASASKYMCVASELKSGGFSPRHISSLWEDSMIPSQDVAWFESDKRFFEWFVGGLDGKWEALSRKNPLKLNCRELCVAVVDLMSSMNSAVLLKNRQQRWVGIKGHKGLVSWIEGGDEKRKIEFISRAFGGEGLEIPDAGVQGFDDFMFWIDRSGFRRLEIENISTKAKRSWQQQSYRGDGSKRKQINMMLDIDVVKKLEILAAEHGLSKAKIVQVLLEEECSRRLYISKRRADVAKGEI